MFSLARLAFLCLRRWVWFPLAGETPLNLPDERNWEQRDHWWPLASLVSHPSQGRGSWALWPEVMGSQGTI